jgi:hypothetical protein
VTDAFALTHPALLWGSAATAIPVLIHLVMRPRPRRLRFPAVVLMRGVLLTGQRASRVRHLLLMLLRAALLACAAALLAGPTWALLAAQNPGATATACVVILDDSLSMKYRPRFESPVTLLDGARTQALEFLDSSHGWPGTSQLAVLRASGPDEAAALTANRPALVAALRDPAADQPHAQPLGHALERAARLLRSADQPARSIVFFTDAAASAWRDVRPAMLAGLDNITIRVVGPPLDKIADLGLGVPVPPAHAWPESTPTPVRVAVRATGVDGECWLVARQGDNVLVRMGPLKVPADTTRDVALSLPALPAGPHVATLELEPQDSLAADQRAYVAWQTGPPPEVWLLAPSGGNADGDVSRLILRNLLAPELLSPAQQRISLRATDAAELTALLAREARRPALIVVLPDVDLPATLRSTLLQAIESGTTAVLVPASSSSDPDWPGLRALLSEAGPTVETLPTASAMRQEAAVTDAAPSDGLAELARCSVRRRVRLSGLLAGVQTSASYTDGAPAILSRRLGRGDVLLLTTSPDPQWSDLGVRAAGLLTWLHYLIGQSVGPPAGAAQFTAGQLARDSFAALPAAGLVQVRQSEPEPHVTWTRLSNGAPQEPWPTATAGLYAVRAASGGETAEYAVNWPAEEFDLTPITRDGLVQVLGTERVTLERAGAADVRPVSGWRALVGRRLDPVALLGLLLLALFAIEVTVASRQSARRPGAAPRE